ncbi:MAG: DegV family protein [Nocardioidaceae bacterium]
MAETIALVTDSTASVPAEAVRTHGIDVVPLQVVIGARSYDEGTEATPETVAAALRKFEPVSTSRATPQAMSDAYERAASAGASAVVSIHLSAEISATYESAQMAAQGSPIPVLTVDSRSVGMGTAMAVLAAVRARDAGAGADGTAAAAQACADATRSFFYVDTLEYLRRGGRVGMAAALVGSALAVKPLLVVRDGRIVPLEKVRTAARALARLEELAVAAVPDGNARVAVQHLANPLRAQEMAQRLRERLSLADVPVSEVGAVIGAHVGPGMVAVVVAPGDDVGWSAA